MTTRGQVRNAFPAMRIFVFGQEVTDDVLSCTVNWADDTRAPATAQFTLANKAPSHRYVLTVPDLKRLHTDIKGDTVELPSATKVLKEDPALQSFTMAYEAGLTRQETAAFLQKRGIGSTASDPAQARERIIARGNSKLQTFAKEEYLPRTQDLVDSINAQVVENAEGLDDPIKARIVAAKVGITQKVSQPDLTEYGKKKINSQARALRLRGEAPRFPMWGGRCIFHSNDPVRIFFKDPFVNVWYHMFAGLVSDWTISTDTDNFSSVMIRCEDALRAFRYSRLTTSPGILDIRYVQQVEDTVAQTFFNDDFTKLTLVELFYFFFFGHELPDLTAVLNKTGNLSKDAIKRQKEKIQRALGADEVKLTRYAANGMKTEQPIPLFGTGAFNFGRSVTFIWGPDTAAPSAKDSDPQTPVKLQQRSVRIRGIDSLATYQAVVDNVVRVSDLETMALDDKAQARHSRSAFSPKDPVTNSPFIEDVIKTIGENPQDYPVDNGRLIMLIPASLGPNTNRDILENMFKGPAMQSTFKSKLGILYDILDRIDFKMFASGKGDILVEMPLYNFDPDDLGKNRVTPEKANTIANTISNADVKAVLRAAAGESSGPYNVHFKVPVSDVMNSDQTFSDDRIRTQMIVPWHLLKGFSAGITSRDIGQVEVETLRALVPQFGVRSEAKTPPLYLTSPEGAKVYANIKLNQLNAEALTSQVDTVPRLRMMPNRPIEFLEGPYIATCRSVSRTLNWEGHDMSQTTGVSYTRVWDGLYDEKTKERIYRPVGGGAAQPLDYASLFKARNLESTKRQPKAAETAETLPDNFKGDD